MTAARTVLVVDDEIPLTDTYRRFLEDEYEVLTANSGRSALRKFDEGVDLVLLDRRMPELSGDEVLAEIRDRDPDCPVAMLTAVDLDDDAVDLPFDEYLVKPVDRDDLREAVRDLLARAERDHESEVLDALGDGISRRLLARLVEGPATAKELEAETSYSLPTIYRKLNGLVQAGLVETRKRINPQGNDATVFAVLAEEARVDIPAGLEVELRRGEE